MMRVKHTVMIEYSEKFGTNSWNGTRRLSFRKVALASAVPTTGRFGTVPGPFLCNL